MKNGNILSEKVNKIRYRKSKGKTSINACCELDCIPWLLSWLQQGAPLVDQTCKLGWGLESALACGCDAMLD